ncbi:MAG: nitroreductase [Chloroflexi bacterium]|nr:nitroreductase [Chloroflexota bacterium]
MKNQLSMKRMLIDGAILSVLLTIIIYGSLGVNPAMWVHDYPPDIRAVVGDVHVPLVQKMIVGVLFFGAAVGVMLYSNAKLRRKLRQQNGGKLSFLAAFANSALILFFFAVWDLLILDWLIFVTIQPDFILLMELSTAS